MAQVDDGAAEEEAEAADFGVSQGAIGGGLMVAAAGFVLAIAAEPRWMGPLLLVIGLAVVTWGAVRVIRHRRGRAGAVPPVRRTD